MDRKNRKLKLNRETIRVLSSRELGQVWGGTVRESEECNSTNCPPPTWTQTITGETDPTGTQTSQACGGDPGGA